MYVIHIYGHDVIYLWNMEYKRQLLRVSFNMFPGYEGPLQRQPQGHQPGLLFFLAWMNCQYHELEVDYMLFTLFMHI